MSTASHRVSRPLTRLLAAHVLGVHLAATLVPSAALAVPIAPPASLAQVPQLLQTQPPPNVFITVDNSGSMLREYLPDEVNFATSTRMFPIPLADPYAWTGNGNPITTLAEGPGNGQPGFVGFSHHINVARNRSSSHNLGYYDPRIRYRPWRTADAAGNMTSYPEAADPAAGDTVAVFNPVHPTRGGLDLAASAVLTNILGNTITGRVLEDTNRQFTAGYTARIDANDAASATVPFALYYRFDTTLANCDTSSATASRDDLDCYARVEIRPTTLTYTVPAGNQRGQADEPGCANSAGVMTCNYQAEFRNFANWFQYYRSRTLLARGAMGNAIADLGDGFRVGLGLINPTPNSTGATDGFTSTTVRIGVRTFGGTHRRSVYDLLHNHETTGSTPSGRALWEVGQYFDWKSGGNPTDPPNTNGPWADTPTVTGTSFAACRQSFHVYSTDGYWNESRTTLFDTIRGIDASAENSDNESGPEICPAGVAAGSASCYTYNPNLATGTFTDALNNTNNRRYRNPDSQTLADISMHFWKRDLQPGIPNRVTPSSSNPAFWQNLSTFAVALALVGERTGQGTTFLQELDAGPPAAWPAPFNSDGGDPRAADDLWHASINSRGRLLIANNPQELSSRLSAALSEIRARSTNAAGAASSSAFLENGTAVFTAEFTQGSSSGDLYRREFDLSTMAFRATDASGNPLPRDGNQDPYVWRASENLPAVRNIVTLRTDSTRAPFLSAAEGGVDATQEALLASPLGTTKEVIDYLRGDRTKEQSAVPPGNFRDRPRPLGPTSNSTRNVLGTIANSTPLYVKDANFLYNFLPTGTPGRDTYLAWQRANRGDGSTTGVNSGRTPTVWVGTNGGMFHAFAAQTDSSRSTTGGAELFAYVPRAVIRNLAQMTEPTYAHRLQVDGVPATGDAYFGATCPNLVNGVDTCWRSVVVSSLGAGGRSVFAIDASQPSALGTSSVLWELDETSLSSSEYSLLGHSFGPAFIHRIKDNTRADGGRWVAVFANGPESAAQRPALFVVDVETGQRVAVFEPVAPNADTAPNGLMAPAPLLDADRQLIGVYAGDMRGNLWKFDLSGPNPAAWNVAFGGAPLFQARNRSGQRQTIYARPSIAPHPAGGVMIAFGTGKMFSPGDRDNTEEQTLYSVRDNLAGNGPLDANYRTSGLMVQQGITSAAGTPTQYTFTNAPVNYAGGIRGWFVDLGVRYGVSGGVVNAGTGTVITARERMIESPSVEGDTLVGLSLIPSTDPCEPGGQSFLYALNATTGSFVRDRSFTLDASGAILMGAGSGYLAFRARGVDPNTNPGPNPNPNPPPPPPCARGYVPVWVVPVGGGSGSWQCVPVGSAGDQRTWRQILEQ